MSSENPQGQSEGRGPTERPHAEMEQSEISPLKKQKRSDPRLRLQEEQSHRVEEAEAELNLTKEDRNRIYKEESLSLDEIDSAEKIILDLKKGKDRSWNEPGENNESTDRICRSIDRISAEIFKDQDWPLQRLNEKTDISSYKKIELVVHPLYSIVHLSPGDEMKGLWDASLWKKSGENIDTYISMHMQILKDDAISKLSIDPKSVPTSYVHLLELTQELEAMRTSSPDTLKVYVMPRKTLLTADKQKAMHSFLGKFSEEKNIFVTDSLHDATGTLQPEALAVLQKAKPEQQLRLQGGYMNACLDACLESIYEISHKQGGSIRIDFDASTAHPATYEFLSEVENRPLIKLPKDSSSDTPESVISDCLQWVKQNSDFNQFLREKQLPKYRHNIEDGIKIYQRRNPDNPLPTIEVGLIHSDQTEQLA